jgi:hypothetical protein
LIASRRPIPGNLGGMTTSSEHTDPSAHGSPIGTNLLPAEAKADVAEIKAENAALAEADREAEAQAEVVTEQARRMAEATEEVLEELRERQ